MSSAVVFSGQAGVATFQAITIKSALRLYARTGMKANRAYTPSAMMKMAAQITGKKFKARDYDGAVNELEIWIARNGAASDPVTA